jgi:hypothetical protein
MKLSITPNGDFRSDSSSLLLVNYFSLAESACTTNAKTVSSQPSSTTRLLTPDAHSIYCITRRIRGSLGFINVIRITVIKRRIDSGRGKLCPKMKWFLSWAWNVRLYDAERELTFVKDFIRSIRSFPSWRSENRIGIFSMSAIIGWNNAGSVAEWSKAPVLGTGPKGHEFESRRCHCFLLHTIDLL